MLIEINDLTAGKVNKNLLKKIAKIILIEENVKKIELSIVLIGRAEMKKINKKYRRKDKATDVLSFRYDNTGELVICPQEVKKNANKFGITFKEELIRILIHGILHFLGYVHEKNIIKAEKMRKKEEYYFKLLWQKHL